MKTHIKSLFRCTSYRSEQILFCLVLAAAYFTSLAYRRLIFGLAVGDSLVDIFSTLFLWSFVFLVCFAATLFLIQICKLLVCIYKLKFQCALVRVIGFVLSMILCYFILNFPALSSEDLLHGFVIRLEKNLDVEEVRQWTEAYIGDNIDKYLSESSGKLIEMDLLFPLPDALAKLKPSYARILVSAPDNYILRVHFGGSFVARWGMDISGAKASGYLYQYRDWFDFPQYRFQWKPGVFLWHDKGEY